MIKIYLDVSAAIHPNEYTKDATLNAENRASRAEGCATLLGKRRAH